MTHITKLDLSKNELIELPENFGDLVKLRYLDLYHNQIKHLPLSFSKLVDLKWLDLKDNPLVPTVAKIAGHCLDAKECQTCAKNIVTFFIQLQEQVDTELKLRQEKLKLEANNKVKKQNDKNPRKNKNKQKPVKIPSDLIPPEKKVVETKKPVKSKKKPNNSCLILNLLNLGLISFVFVVPVLFILTSINIKCLNFAKEYATNAYIIAINKLPPNLHEQGIIFGNFVENLHQKTGNYTNNIINIIERNEDFRYFYNVINNYVDKFLNNIKEIYNNFVQ